MNSMQIKCFLALAETLNYSRAAQQLYLTQPGLSHQIASLEQELNTKLFTRNLRQVQLTPAGALLAKEIGNVIAAGEDLFDRVRMVGCGYTGTLTVGVLEGQWLGEPVAKLIHGFMEAYPNIDLRIVQSSFGELRTQLISGKLDVILTLCFDIRDLDGITWVNYVEDRSVLAVSRRLPLASLERVTAEDLSKETLLVISPEDSKVGSELLLTHVKQRGISTQNIRYAPNLSTMILWIEMGLGVGVVNGLSVLAQNPAVRLIDELPLDNDPSCVAWRKDNLNPAVLLFRDYTEAQL